MSITLYISGTFIAILAIYLNIVVTVVLFRTKDLNQFQKWSQCILAWLIPYFGAWIVLSILRETDPESIPRTILGYRVFGWLETAETRNTAWTGSDSHTSHHHDNCNHDSGSGGHDCS